MWHGSMTPVDRFDGSRGRSELHLGTLEQASMRGGRHLYLFEIDPAKTRRIRDGGEVGKTQCRAARAAGMDALVYLNRYEGISVESVQNAMDAGIHDRIDSMTDREFLKWFPEARDSWAILNPEDASLIASFECLSSAREFIENSETEEELAL